MNVPRLHLRALNWGRVAGIVALVAVVVAVGVGVQALSAPVQRAGAPTIAVPAPTGTRSVTPTASGSASASAGSSASPSASGTAPSTPKSTIKASGDFDWSDTSVAASGSTGTLYRYAVAVESSAKLKPDAVAGAIATVLNDPRSWTGDGEVRFALGPQAKADVEVYLASSKTAASLCGTDAEAGYTCVKGNTVVINAQQWKTPAPGYGGDLARYRTFLVNHAFGHLIGRAHAKCSGKGKAPVMLQQGAGLGGCAVNPWP